MVNCPNCQREMVKLPTDDPNNTDDYRYECPDCGMSFDEEDVPQ